MNTIKSFLKTLLINDITLAVITCCISLLFSAWVVTGLNVFFYSFVLETILGLASFPFMALVLVCLTVDYQQKSYSDFVSVTDFV